MSPVIVRRPFYLTAKESKRRDKSETSSINGRRREEGRKGVHNVVIEVGREVTGFVRIFARPMRDAS